MSSTAKPRRRLSADERRKLVISAAVTEFSLHGYEGTATDAIAVKAGVSQPYLFQLFGSKRELFIATMQEAFARTWQAFETAGEAAKAIDPSAESILRAMGNAYCDLLRDRELLRCQLQAYAACANDDIRPAMRAEFSELYRRVAELSGAPIEILDVWFAHGMLMNTIAAIAPDLTNDGENISLSRLTPVEGAKPSTTLPAATGFDAAYAAKAAFQEASASASETENGPKSVSNHKGK